MDAVGTSDWFSLADLMLPNDPSLVEANSVQAMLAKIVLSMQKAGSTSTASLFATKQEVVSRIVENTAGSTLQALPPTLKSAAKVESPDLKKQKVAGGA